MDDEEFWALVEAARDASRDNVDDRPGALEQLLMSRQPDEVQDFQDRYDEMLRRANRWSLWGAAWLMNGGCSDDDFRYSLDGSSHVVPPALKEEDFTVTAQKRD